MLSSFAVNAKLICVFVFAYPKSRFSHDEAQLSVTGERVSTKYWLTASVKPTQEKCVKDNMTSAVYCGT